MTGCMVNVLENGLPSIIMFPRVYFQSYMLVDAPNNILGLDAKLGWIKSKFFVHVLKNVMKPASFSTNTSTLNA